MFSKILALFFIFVLFIGQTSACCCCDPNSNSYKTVTNACLTGCILKENLHPPCVEACSNDSFLYQIKQKTFRLKLRD